MAKKAAPPNRRSAPPGGSDFMRRFLAPRMPAKVVSTTISAARSVPKPWYETIMDEDRATEDNAAEIATGRNLHTR